MSVTVTGTDSRGWEGPQAGGGAATASLSNADLYFFGLWPAIGFGDEVCILLGVTQFTVLDHEAAAARRAALTTVTGVNPAACDTAQCFFASSSMRLSRRRRRHTHHDDNLSVVVGTVQPAEQCQVRKKFNT